MRTPRLPRSPGGRLHLSFPMSLALRPERCPGSPPVLEQQVGVTHPQGLCTSTGLGPGFPAMESDAALAWALQQELGQEPAPTPLDGLEEKGLFFCQICQKNLSAMNPTRREQHVNR